MQEASSRMQRSMLIINAEPKKGANGLFLTSGQAKVMTEAVERLGLCRPGISSKLLQRVLLHARIPTSLLKQAMPTSDMWNHALSEEVRAAAQQSYVQAQNLWRLLIQESGLKVAKEWQQQSLALLGCIAVLENSGQSSPVLPGGPDSILQVFAQ